MAIEDKAIRSFGVFLRGLADGEAELELSDALKELLAASKVEAKVRNTKTKAKLTLELAIEVDPKDTVSFSYDIKRTEPKKLRTGTTMFLTRSGALSHAPQQVSLPLREVNQEAEPRDVEDDVGPAREA